MVCFILLFLDFCRRHSEPFWLLIPWCGLVNGLIWPALTLEEDLILECTGIEFCTNGIWRASLGKVLWGKGSVELFLVPTVQSIYLHVCQPMLVIGLLHLSEYNEYISLLC